VLTVPRTMPPPARIPWAMHELDTAFVPCEYRVKWADSVWETRHALALRRAVFCSEQGLFDGDDRDRLDDSARLLVALACVAGVAEAVIGTVRIAEIEPGRWWGSRLAVAREYRRHGRVGASLIRLAVSSAHALGCREFLAHVQSQNVPLFEHLRWTALDEVELHGRPHRLMRADLASYPPCGTPLSGFVTRAERSPA